MATYKRLETHLRNIRQVLLQVQGSEDLGLSVEKGIPAEVDNLGQMGLDVYYLAQQIKGKVEADVGHRDEGSQAREVVLDKLSDIETILGENGQHLAFIQATSLDNLRVLVGYILEYPEVFQQTLESLDAQGFAGMEDILDRARTNRGEK